MSVKIMGLVWDTDLRPTDRFVLLAYADHADHNGRNIYPSIKLIAAKTGFSTRTVQNSTRDLEKLGYLIPDGQGPKGTNRWFIPPDVGVQEIHPPDEGVNLTTEGGESYDAEGVNLTTERGAGDSPEPLKNHQSKPSVNHKRGDRPLSVELCKRIIYRYPHKSLWKTIDRKIGKDFISLLKWGRLLRVWKLNDWNVTNYKAMLDAFSRNDRDNPQDFDSELARQTHSKSWEKARPK